MLVSADRQLWRSAYFACLNGIILAPTVPTYDRWIVVQYGACALKLLQTITVDLDASSGEGRCIALENIAHVVKRSHGRWQDRGQTLSLTVDSIYENSRAGKSIFDLPQLWWE